MVFLQPYDIGGFGQGRHSYSQEEKKKTIDFGIFSRDYLISIINRPGVAGAVLQTPPLLIN